MKAKLMVAALTALVILVACGGGSMSGSNTQEIGRAHV